MLAICLLCVWRAALLDAHYVELMLEKLHLEQCNFAAHANSTHLRIGAVQLKGVESEDICGGESDPQRSAEPASGGTEKDLLLLKGAFFALGSK